MHYALSTAKWPKEEGNKLEDITNLGVRYASMADGPEREAVLLLILRAFHSYLLKYTDMIQRGHLPTFKGHVSSDTATFSASFCAPAKNLSGQLFRPLVEPCTWPSRGNLSMRFTTFSPG